MTKKVNQMNFCDVSEDVKQYLWDGTYANLRLTKEVMVNMSSTSLKNINDNEAIISYFIDQFHQRCSMK